MAAQLNTSREDTPRAETKTLRKQREGIVRKIAIFSNEFGTSAGFWYCYPTDYCYRGITVLTKGFNLPEDFGTTVGRSAG